MPTLRLSFSGLCTFIFDPPLSTFPFEADLSLEKATVLLQRLTRSRLLSNELNLRPEVLDQHFPLLEFSLDDYKKERSSRKPNFRCSPTRDNENQLTDRMTKGVCLLNGEELSILSDTLRANDRLKFSRLKPKDPDDPLLNRNPEELESLFWMATLENALPGEAALNPRLVDTPPGLNQPILAKVILPCGGRLRTRELTDLPYTLNGNGAIAGFPRRVAIAFELEMPFRKKIAFKFLSRFNGTEETRFLVLAPKSGDDIVEVGIANMEIDRFIGIDPAAGPRVAADFEVYFDLLRNPIAPGQPRPFLRLAAPGNSSGQGGVSSCAPSGAR